MICLLWFFQAFLLDDFYTSVKQKNAEKALLKAVAAIESASNELDRMIADTAEYYDVCLIVIDSRMNIIANGESTLGCPIHSMTKMGLVSLYNAAKLNGGTYTERYKLSKQLHPLSLSEAETTISTTTESIVTTQIIIDSNGNTRILIMSSVLTPVNVTIEALRFQLIIITIITVLFAAILAMLIARSIAKPIINMSISAGKLAKGQYDTDFSSTSGYREIDELGDSLNNAAYELSKLDRMRKDLIANISHELRTPLTLISGYAEVMRDIPGENNGENLEVILKETNRLSQLVNDALDVSKLQSGNVTLNRNVFCITDSISAIIERISKLTELSGYQIDFESSEQCCVNADEMKISQVIYNLVGNAINYTGDDKKVIVRQIVMGNTVKIEVADNGKGIKHEDLPYVFDRYYRSLEVHRKPVVGTGLGLSIVKEILTLHNAVYGVTSGEGFGTTFWFELNINSKN